LEYKIAKIEPRDEYIIVLSEKTNSEKFIRELRHKSLKSITRFYVFPHGTEIIKKEGEIKWRLKSSDSLMLLEDTEKNSSKEE